MINTNIKGNLGVYAMSIMAFVPVLLWLYQGGLGIRFEGFYMTLRSIGQIAALIGTGMYVLTLILNERLHFLEKYFGGLDRMYLSHRIFGTLTFTFLIIHPLSLAIALVPLSVIDAALFLIPGADWAVNFGIIALLLMMSLLVVTFFARVKYQYMRYLHKFLGAAFFFGVLHAFLIPSDLSQNLLLKSYVLGISVVALIAYLYRTIFGAYLVKKFLYVVDEVNILNDVSHGVEN